ncbi:uncharacterized protein FOMMEDRAFT_135948 [Fomitiporia mediterranea MF3/22]|uniref:uncharacterized protein n=1 Tax=Fomitiporia mediterranea (strain MF3/22) TaxID=694068 RepID=UPI0004408882|nr:uncharacterized protein FOMMEDRAFT_135948 [Fomitiporia mediterranea MF3/22]EJD00364.1 hypothetical protein FOMMEDRAFT_135948 [Fomitiporia mediterranea MF3/22]
MDGPFGAVTQTLLKLGSCPIENLAHSSMADLEGFDLPGVSPDIELLPVSSKSSLDQTLVVSEDKESQKLSSSMQFVAQLYQTCVRAFGNAEALKFEFIEETGQENQKMCVLTITRPNGQTRSYKTDPEFSRKSDAKAQAAARAIELGAVDFILHGNKDTSNPRQRVVLAPLNSTAPKSEAKVKEEDPVPDEIIDDDASKQIEALCVEWRASRIQPRWRPFREFTASPNWGSVLVIELSPHSQRLYSVEPTHASQALAKKACSETALQQGVIDFIKYGNGQTAPAPVVTDALDDAASRQVPSFDRGRGSAISLQSFFDSLPKPFPEPIGDNALVTNINAPGMLNTTLQQARGARLNFQFYYLSECGLHGCILRLDRPEEMRTYMVDPRFTKRTDAKSAVCLRAMSQGVVPYIRSLASAIDNRITSEMRKQANERILPILGSEYGRLRHGMHPAYDFNHDQGAFGCTMTLSLSSGSNPDEVKSWSVKPEYRTKTDAKIAVVCAAGVEAIEFVRFRGEPPPPDHDPFKPYKRREREGSSEQQRPNPKRPNTTSGLVRLGPSTNVPLLETKEEAKARQVATARWKHDRFPPSRTHRGQYQRSRNLTQTLQPFSNSHYSREYQVNETSTYLPYDDPPSPSTAKSQKANTSTRTYHHQELQNNHYHEAHAHSTSHPTSSEYSRAEIERLRPPRRSQRRTQQLTQHSLPSADQSSYAASEPLPQTSPPAQHTIPQSPSQPTSYQFIHYGAVSQPSPPAPQQSAPYPSVPYHPGYVQAPYSYPVQQNPHPYNGYPYPMTHVPPTTPPTYGVPAYPAYTAYYADPRYAQYAQYPQYAMSAAPFAYAVPVAPPTPGVPYPAPPPPAPAQPQPQSQLTAPEESKQESASLPTPPGSDEPAESSARRTEIAAGASGLPRAASFSSESDRHKRPRSRDMSMSPDDLQLHKKHRSESSISSSVKRESANSTPILKTPVLESKDSLLLSNVEQLIQYCESNGLVEPEFVSKQAKNELGQSEFKVWIVMGTERLELPILFQSENEGRQRVAKQVLQRLKSQSQTNGK